MSLRHFLIKPFSYPHCYSQFNVFRTNSSQSSLFPWKTFVQSENIDTRIAFLCKVDKNVRAAACLCNDSFTSGTIIPSSQTCNFLIMVLRKSGEHELAFSVYKNMTHVGIKPLFFSLAAVLEYFVNSVEPMCALGVVGLIWKHGFDVNVYLMNLVLKGLCQNGDIDRAMQGLQEMSKNSMLADVISFHIVVNALCKAKRVEEALNLVDLMKSAGYYPNIRSYTSILDGPPDL